MVEINGAYDYGRYEKIWVNSLCVMSNVKVFAMQDIWMAYWMNRLITYTLRPEQLSSVLGSLSCMMQLCTFNPHLSLQQRGLFPWSLHGFWLHSPKTLLDEYKPWGLEQLTGTVWARCPAWCSVTGSILLWGNFPSEGIFPLELTWVRTPLPKELFWMRV